MSDEPERIVVAAVDSSVAANPVLVAARALARMLDARVEAIHVVTDGEGPTPDAAASAVGVPLRVVPGPVVDSLIEAAHRPGSLAVVIGARSSPKSPHALGSTALAVVTSCERPVVVVPPAGRVAPLFGKVLVPLEGTISTSLVPRAIVELGGRSQTEVVALHVDEDGSALDDEELLRRFCPWGIGLVSLERRTGAREDVIPATAEELRCDLVALGWARALARGRDDVVRATLERATMPVMLIPVELEARQSIPAAAGAPA
jgi:nucleotide-binding universal stress UspA family protein